MGWGELSWWRFGTVVTPFGYSYTFTADDAMWMMKATWGEVTGRECGGPGQGVIWTMINRMVHLRDKPMGRRDGIAYDPPHSLTEVIRAYSKVVNPYWAARESSWEIARREKFTNATLEEIPPCLVRRVRSIFTGREQIPARFVGMVHFGTVGMTEHIGIPDLIEGEAFHRVGSTRSWTENTVRVERPGTPVLLPLAFGAAAVAVVLAFRGR